MRIIGLSLCLSLIASAAWAQVSGETVDQTVVPMNAPKGVWQPDQGDGTFINPVLMGDYSDPDAVRVGDDYYLTASSFTNIPGLPILHSKDMVNWSLIGHALPRQVPDAHHAIPRRGGGVWAPAIRHHNGLFYIYYPDPDYGIFVVTARDPAGPWSEPVKVEGAKGVIDPAPFWDEDGQGWLVYAYARSRSGRMNIVALKKLNADGTQTVGEERVIINGDPLPKVMTSQGLKSWVVIEGPKLYKRNGYYYIFAPAGGVKGGWQAVFRSRKIEGPYEARNVLDQGATPVNGPHQGAWVDTPSGQDWFLHFQDTDAYGRRVHLQPMQWGKDGWPVIGERQKGRTFGQPVLRFKKPVATVTTPVAPIVSDEFDGAPHLGWQWSANPSADWREEGPKGVLRLKSASSPVNLWESGQFLTQKLPGLSFSATTKLTFAPWAEGERAGLIVFGYSYGWIGLEKTKTGVRLVQVNRPKANTGGAETVAIGPEVTGPVWLKVDVSPVTVKIDPPADATRDWPSMSRSVLARATFSYSLDGQNYTPLGEAVLAEQGRWVGAQVGLFAQSPSGTPSYVSTRVGYADFDFFKVP